MNKLYIEYCNNNKNVKVSEDINVKTQCTHRIVKAVRDK